MSIQIDPQIERDLAELAGKKNISVNALLREFTATEKRYWQELAEDMDSIEQARNGDYMSQEDFIARTNAMIAQAQDLNKSGD